jgi:hypothetical protein
LVGLKGCNFDLKIVWIFERRYKLFAFLLLLFLLFLLL